MYQGIKDCRSRIKDCRSGIKDRRLPSNRPFRIKDCTSRIKDCRLPSNRSFRIASQFGPFFLSSSSILLSATSSDRHNGHFRSSKSDSRPVLLYNWEFVFYSQEFLCTSSIYRKTRIFYKTIRNTCIISSI